MFKKVTIDDASDILAFCLELKKQDAKMSFTSFDSIEKVNSYINDEHNFLYLSVHDGFINAMFTAIRGGGNKSHSCYVACAVKKEFRQQNLATALTNYGLEDVKTVGVLIARTKIYSWNIASIATIKKCGFVESGRMVMHQYDKSIEAYIDDLIFHKVL